MKKFAKNVYSLKYDDRLRRFVFGSNEALRMYQKELKDYINNAKIVVSNDSFSAKDEASLKFINSDFWMNILDSVSDFNEKSGKPLILKNSDVIKNLYRFKKMDINYDFLYGDRIYLKEFKKNPGRYVDRKTHINFIFTTDLRDEMYEYTLYIKLYINEVDKNVYVQSLHWNDYNNPSCKVEPSGVYNIQTGRYDSYEKCSKWLEKKISSLQ